MKKLILILGIIGLFLFLPGYSLFAQEETSGTDWKEEILSGKEQIGEQKQAIKENAEVAKQEENQLRQQIQEAVQAGNIETAGQLRQQLRTLHEQNIQERHLDRQALQEYRGELKQDVQAAKQERLPPPPPAVGTEGKPLPPRVGDRHGPHPAQGPTQGLGEGIRDHGKGIGAGKGKGGEMRAPGAGPKDEKPGQGVRDHGKGIGAGKGQGGERRSPKAAPKGGSATRGAGRPR